jgi:hypothetical protein
MDIATARSPLHLNNILVSPSLVKNLISVRTLTRDNNVSVDFDPFGFSIKDLPTRTELLRCESRGELYPLASDASIYKVAVSSRPNTSSLMKPNFPFVQCSFLLSRQ